MSPRALFVLLLVGVITIAAVQAHSDCLPPKPIKCKVNEVWTDCGTACEPSCKVPKPQVCTQQCVVGCQCKKGYLRDAKKNCVLPCDC